MWVFYRGGFAVPSGSYGTEFTAFAVVANSKKNIPAMDGNSDF